MGDITLPNIRTYKYSDNNIWYNTCGGKNRAMKQNGEHIQKCSTDF